MKKITLIFLIIFSAYYSGTSQCDPPSVSIIADGDSTLQAEVFPNSANSFSWSNGATSQTVTNLSPGSYCVTVGNSIGCSTRKCATVPMTTCSVDIDYYPPTSQLSASVTGNFPISYSWNIDGNTSNNPQVDYTPGSIYSLTITDGTGCTSSIDYGCFPEGITFTSQQQIDSFSINYPGCTTIEGPVQIFDIDTILTSHSITNLNGLAQITKMKDDLFVNVVPHLHSATGLNNLTGIGGRLYLRGNSFDDLLGFENITTIGGDLIIDLQQELVSVRFPGLTHIGGALNIMENTSIQDLDGLSNLQSIGSYLRIFHNQNLASLSGLSSLTSIHGKLNIIANGNSLVSLVGLENIDPHSIKSPVSGQKDLTISANQGLSNCAIQSVCGVLFLPNKTVTISNNKAGCNEASEINCSEVGAGGVVYYDANQNGQRDSDEYGISGQHIHSLPSGSNFLTNASGQYFQACQAGEEYTFSWNPNPNWNLTSSPASYTFTYTPGDPANQTKDFGIFPAFTGHIINASIASNQTRCNEPVDFFLNVKNEGTFTENGQVSLSYEPNIQYLYASPVPDIVDTVNKLIIWNYSDLNPWQTLNYQLTFQMPPASTPVEWASLTESVFYENSDSLVQAAQVLYYSPIHCSFDPNDKLVNPPGINEEHFTLKDQTLTYTIRFQNTGSTYAKDIFLKDTLDSHLDWTSFKVLNSSHEVQTSISPEGLVTFLFRNIYLQDSSKSLTASQGFVTYSIAPKSDLPENTVIHNTANIYFDFNPAIVTNTTTNTLVSQLPVAVQEVSAPTTFTLYPNPTSDKFYILLDNYDKADELDLIITDLTGKIIQTQTTHYQRITPVQADNFPKGMYFISLQNPKTGAILHTQKLVVE